MTENIIEHTETEYWKKQMEHEPTRSYYETLYKIAKRLRGRTSKFLALEIGTGWGISGSAFLNADFTDLVTIDCNLSAEYGQLTKAELESKQKEGQRIKFINERIENIRTQLLAEYGGKCHVVYIDGNHEYKPCLDDLFMAWELCHCRGHIILDDYLHAKNLNGGDYGIIQAVRELQLKKQVTAKIVPTSVNGLCLIKKPGKKSQQKA